MDRTQKNAEVAAIRDRFGKMAAAVATDFRGLDVDTMNALRSKFREVDGIEYKVVKNTLTKLAIKEESYSDGFSQFLTGPTAIVWSYEDPIAPAKIIVNFAKSNDKLKIKGGVVDGEIVDEAGVLALSKMPGKDEIKAHLLATFMAPANDLVRLFAAAPSNFVYLLEARKNAIGE
jgi:large subunit ribosomal protein L10